MLVTSPTPFSRDVATTNCPRGQNKWASRWRACAHRRGGGVWEGCVPLRSWKILEFWYWFRAIWWLLLGNIHYHSFFTFLFFSFLLLFFLLISLFPSFFLSYFSLSLPFSLFPLFSFLFHFPPFFKFFLPFYNFGVLGGSLPPCPHWLRPCLFQCNADR